MRKPAAPLPNIAAPRLFISTPEQLAMNKAKEAKRTAYYRQYWQSYKQRMRRVYGTLPIAEFASFEALANENGRTVWDQIISDARAYHAGTVLAPKDILNAQDELVGELRRIGNNMNQLARMGHIQAAKNGALNARADDKIGYAVMRLFTKLEKCITHFAAIIPSFIFHNSSETKHDR